MSACHKSAVLHCFEWWARRTVLTTWQYHPILTRVYAIKLISTYIHVNPQTDALETAAHARFKLSFRSQTMDAAPCSRTPATHQYFFCEPQFTAVVKRHIIHTFM
ncbi:uncharacterized protein PHALS_13115 [Plasmopara halstedii]|uniref:Uncharacterized protein n=1 Tax=Plasmopara halstedii TaxID=4781 RepID=A0A0P1ANZ6_PLAHL|nr:uncharacterized protein PHALS_13115 [Plasmopara halstedii]CEG42878.1 hypothetical protein PHALS_13115 [Plasmopara halstedii]|eukprot:XP_024579247.1 hypothetical protein PHALS_13115 [Plasmopara halstedii]